MSAHTAGPWEVFGEPHVPSSITSPGVDSVAGDRFTIVVFGNADEPDAGIQGRTPQEAWANARLIAAAPDLLDIARDLLMTQTENDLGVVGDVVDDLCKRVQAVLARINGAVQR